MWGGSKLESTPHSHSKEVTPDLTLDLTWRDRRLVLDPSAEALPPHTGSETGDAASLSTLLPVRRLEDARRRRLIISNQILLWNSKPFTAESGGVIGNSKRYKLPSELQVLSFELKLQHFSCGLKSLAIFVEISPPDIEYTIKCCVEDSLVVLLTQQKIVTAPQQKLLCHR